MNDNVGDMPIEIFGDYISDMLGEDWSWEYIIPMFNYMNDLKVSPTQARGNGYCNDYGGWYPTAYGNGRIPRLTNPNHNSCTGCGIILHRHGWGNGVFYSNGDGFSQCSGVIIEY